MNAASPLSSLLDRARQGDRCAFERLIEPLKADLRALAARKLGQSRRQSRLSADDLLQETLLRAWAKMHLFQHDEDEIFRAWVLVIHRNVIFEALRTLLGAKRDLRREASLDPLEPACSQKAPPQAVDEDELRSRLLRALACLSAPQQAALRLRFLEELSHQEIAARMNCTPGSVQGHLRRGLAELRRQSGADLKAFLSGMSSWELGHE